MDEKQLPDLSEFPEPPPPLRLVKIDRISIPHPFCITEKHVVFAADHRSGMLNEEAIAASGAPCGICKKPYDEHTVSTALFVEGPQNRDLNAVQGLHTYLLQFKPTP